MSKRNVLAEKGQFKKQIHSALYKNPQIRELILGDTSNMSSSDIQIAFKNHVKSHLFIDDTITETDTFIFYDVIFPTLTTHLKQCNVIMYLISHRDILENYQKEGYHGDRIDILSQMVVETLVEDEKTANSFGIGKLNIDSVNIYNTKRFYGCMIKFSVPDFF